jgi:PAS domain S-box-containing protein
MPNSVITTDKAKCRDCYRCVRVCPVKAIRISEGQAKVEDVRCILCGTCVRECPQTAKHVRDDTEVVSFILQKPPSAEYKVIASVAPSYPASFPEYEPKLMPSALRKLGFDLVTETSVGAELVASATAKLLSEDNNAWVTSACPVVVNIVQKYYPNLCSNITPFVSPMVAHAKCLKSKYGEDSKVIFIGPCSAKKAEADGEKPIVDGVLTFEELDGMFKKAGIEPAFLASSDFDDLRAANAQLFPLDGGLAKTAAIESGLFTENFAAVSGKEHILEMIENLGHKTPIKLFEALFCSGGCINGACISTKNDIFDRKSRILEHHKNQQSDSREVINPANVAVQLKVDIKPEPIIQKEFTEEEIRAVMLLTGKKTSEDELNCGACGYESCRGNALAVLLGMAESNMCLPWMRTLAEKKANQIIDSSPNGIVVIDNNFSIVSFNPAFANMFGCGDECISKPISTFMDPEDFERVAAKVLDMVNSKTVEFTDLGIIASVSIYRLEEENVLIGIFANITKTKEDEDRITRMRTETLANAQEVIEKQMRMAQEIASILGETTSETRVLLRKLTDLAREQEK